MSSVAPFGESSPGASAHGSRQNRHWRIVVVAMLVALLGIWYLVHTLSSQKPKSGGAQAIPVGTARAERGDLDVYLDSIGTVTPVYTDTIVSRVAGEVTEVHFKEGQMVKKNDLLAIIDPRPYVAAELQAKGQLERDIATLKNARIDLKRYEQSFAAHAIPEQELATQRATVDADEATVKLDQGNYDAARINVIYTQIVSPIEGRVGLRNIDPGNVVPANGTTGLCTITQLKPITVIFVIPEDSIDEVVEQMHTGRPMQVLALDRAKQKVIATGALLTLDNEVNTTTGTVRARATFPNTHEELFPYQFVNARLRVRTLTGATLVPQAAIQHNGDAAFVYAVQADNSVKSTDIRILATEGETSAVSGIAPNQVLVTDGFDKLQNGSKIVARRTTTPTSMAPAVSRSAPQAGSPSAPQAGSPSAPQAGSPSAPQAASPPARRSSNSS